MLDLIVFYIIAIATIVSAGMVVYSSKIVHSVVYLAGSLIGVAALFILLNAEFLGIIQLLIYVGAVIILILFAIMLTKKEEK